MNSCSKPARPSRHSRERRVHRVPDVDRLCAWWAVAGHDSPGNLDPPGPRLSLGPQAYSPHTPNLTSTPRLLQYPDFTSYSDAPFAAPKGKWAPTASPPLWLSGLL